MLVVRTMIMMLMNNFVIVSVVTVGVGELE